MTRKTHTMLFGLGLLGVSLLFTLLVIREILVRMIGYEAQGVDPIMLATFAIVGIPTAFCVWAFALPKMLERTFSGPRTQADVDRAKAILRPIGLLVEDRPSEGNVATNRGRHNDPARGSTVSKKVD